MENKQGSTGVKIITAITFIVMIVINALANILPINGINTGQVSDSYPNLFAPAALTFAIWGLIYLLLAGFTLYQFGLFQSKSEPARMDLLRRTGIVFSISSLANAAWIFAWHYRNIPLSMLLMIVILICLITITKILNKEQLSMREKVFIKLPFSVYFGWITVATIANATTLFVSLGWNGFGLSDPVWTVIILCVGMLIGVTTTIRNKDLPYGLVLIWAYAGIYIKQSSSDGFSGQYPEIIAAVIGCLTVMLFSLVYVLITGKRR
ncbi:MAG: tryptophan-rich sensory protein [Flexilinea sp.]